MLPLYPPIKPYTSHSLKVEPPHQLYIEESGNPQGLPVLFVHGGPGSGCNEDHRRFFNPEYYRIILFDQRGAGRSTPRAELKNNNTAALIADIEAIRQLLSIDKWILFGGSWGAALSLLYAQAYPENVRAMILYSIYLVRNEDIEWVYGKNGACRIFPDAWQEFIRIIPENQRNNIILSYYEKLSSNNELERMAAAKAWSTWVSHCCIFKPAEFPKIISNDNTSILCKTLIECHYLINNCFLEPNQILRNMDKIHNIPGIIVHGRYDIACPVENAWSLNQSWPKSELNIIREAGHTAFEPAMVDGLIRATQQMVFQLSKH